MFALILALQAAPAAPAPLPQAFVEQAAALSNATVVSGFCLSLGWVPGSRTVAEDEIARLRTEHGVSQSDAQILILRQMADAGEALKAEFPTPPDTPTQATRLAFLDHVDAYSRRACAEVATAYPAFFTGDIASNQALVDARIAAVRQQELTRP
ncbi:hypothetical protein [Brevundimonas sp.]